MEKRQLSDSTIDLMMERNCLSIAYKSGVYFLLKRVGADLVVLGKSQFKTPLIVAAREIDATGAANT